MNRRQETVAESIMKIYMISTTNQTLFEWSYHEECDGGACGTYGTEGFGWKIAGKEDNRQTQT
jgi:hypothetical protein